MFVLNSVFLKNFHFLHDQAMQQEDEFWSHGASAKQIKELASVFKKFDKSSSPFNILRLSGVRMELPYPLGFDTRRKRRIFTFENDKLGYVAWLLIRAELNVLARGRRFEASCPKSFDEIFLEFVGLSRQRKTYDSFGFHETIMTIFRWRMPLMVPKSVKLTRMELIPEIVLTSYALTLYDFLSKCVAEKRRAALKLALSYAFRMHNWRKRDEACCRRMELLHTINSNQEDEAKRTTGFRYHKKIPVPQLREDCFLFRLQRIESSSFEDTFVSHQQAFEEYSVDKRSLMSGIQVFKFNSKRYSVVLKFVDALNAHRGEFVADLSGFKWSGWASIESKTDALLQLTTRNLIRLRKLGLKAQRAGCSISFATEGDGPIVQTVSDGGSEQFGDAVCNLIDLHAFEIPDFKVNGGIRQVLRLNLGPKFENMSSSSLVFDGVMEVLGYVSWSNE